MGAREIVLPDPLTRGVYCTAAFRNGVVPVFAVTSAGEILAEMSPATRAEFEAAVAMLERLLEQEDPPRAKRSRGRKGTGMSELARPALYLVRETSV